MIQPPVTFAKLPFCMDFDNLDADIAILGVPFGTPYDLNDLHSIDAPRVIRAESNRYSGDPLAWDFDLNSTLLGDGSVKIVDCLDIPGQPAAGLENRQQIKKHFQKISEAGAVPVVLGGDDSIPIPIFQAYENQAAFHVLQLDAHIDWRDEVNGVREGYSSTMRRASELDCVSRIVQVGARGVGSARKEEFEAAQKYGARIISANQFLEQGIGSVTNQLKPGSRVFITMDYDVLDPSEMPAVGAPSPGGLRFQDVLELFKKIISEYEIVGVNLVEFVPHADVNNLGAITAMRIAWITIGSLVRKFEDRYP